MVRNHRSRKVHRTNDLVFLVVFVFLIFEIVFVLPVVDGEDGTILKPPPNTADRVRYVRYDTMMRCQSSLSHTHSLSSTDCVIVS
mmetsp:Transcript_28278/g.68810  ORF Transcript_28278/g.68810 Transcript_28278/m.68810 type:complete len:85 (-) Transcript_28278:7-261(-)